MKKVLQKVLPEEIKALHAITQRRKINRDLFDYVVREVRKAKNANKQRATDRLHQKHANYGNDGGWAIAQMNELCQGVWQNKSPDTADIGRWLSVEIECIFDKSGKDWEFARWVRKQGYGKYVTLKEDGSIHPHSDACGCEDDEHRNCPHVGKEVVVTFKYGEWEMLQGICAKLVSMGCYVNRSCGLHVHFDCRDKTPRQVTLWGQRVACAIPALKQILPRSRHDNRFCEVDINRHCNGDDRHSRARRRNSEARYAFVNLMSYQRHKTLEIRGHSGTLDAHKIISWIRILRVIMDKRCTKNIGSVAEMIGTYNFDTSLVAYINARFQKFHNEARPRGDDVMEDNSAEAMQRVAQILGQPVMRAEEAPVLAQPAPQAVLRVNGERVATFMASDVHIPVNTEAMREAMEALNRRLEESQRAMVAMPNIWIDSLALTNDDDNEVA